jgi:hypothetical protein
MLWIALVALVPLADAAFTSNVTVMTGSKSADIVSPGFVGFSIEVSSVLHMIGDDGNKLSYAQCLRNLAQLTPGPHAGPVLRLGGNSADGSCYDMANKTVGCKYEITANDLASYYNFAANTASDVNVTYTIDTDFGVSPDPRFVAKAHMEALVRSYLNLLALPNPTSIFWPQAKAELWPFVNAIEIGNEMDIYAKANPAEQKAKGHRNSSYNYNKYEPEFANFLSVYKAEAGMPTKMVQGGTFCSLSQKHSWASNVSRYIGKFAPELKTFSYHRYPISHCNGDNVTQADLLADKSVGGQVDALSPFIEAAKANRVSGGRGSARDGGTVGDGGLLDLAGPPPPLPQVPFWIGEGNSVSCGGMPGVSNTFTTALWVGDFLSRMSKAGVAGMNFHGGPAGAYPAIAYAHPVETGRWG